MTPKKNYSRYFIILQEDEKGYSLESDKIPSGYAKLEMKNSKCKISYYVQNLRKEKQPYYMVLICGKKDVNKIIKVGKLNIDDHGRVDIFHEYDMDNIADTGINAERIIGAAIVKFLDNNVISIMSGFSTTEKPNEWKSYKLADSNKETKETIIDETRNEFDEYEQNIEIIKVKSDKVIKNSQAQENVNKKATNDEANVEKTKTEKVVGKKAEKVVDKKEEKVTDKKVENKVDSKQNADIQNALHLQDSKNAQDVHGKKENVKQRVQTNDTLNLDNQSVNTCDIEIPIQVEDRVETGNPEFDFEDITRDKDKKCCKEDNKPKEYECNKKENDYYKAQYPKGSMGNFFKAIAEDFVQVPNFSKEIKWCTWYKVPVHNLENMYDLSDYNKYTIAYYPMICYYPYIRNYKSFMLGYKCDSKGNMKYLVYGIPGSRNKAHQPYGGKTGFVTWIADKGNDEMGHWLMFYDFRNSTIVVPVKK